MQQSLAVNPMQSEQDRRISETIRLERARLQNFIRRRVPDRRDAEDILQDVFHELIEAHRLMKPIANAGAWLFTVARNRITDLFRKKKVEALSDPAAAETGESYSWADLLPSPDAGPDAAYARRVLMDEIAEALAELPQEQRDVFTAHELEGRRFKQLAAETGINVNTLISRKHYAVLHLRRRLQAIYDEFDER
jgi:RNA polymerase sigma factor (sigma-70 family)